MNIIPVATALAPEKSGLRLARYSQLIGYDERAFFGIKFTGMERRACREIWTKDQRDMVQRYLWEAQLEIEQQVGYPLAARWIADEEPYTDLQRFSGSTMRAKWHHVIEPGIRAVADISLGVAVDHSSDPAIIGPVALLSGVSLEEVIVFLPGTEIDIPISGYTLAGQNLTIEIPRARLIKASSQNNPDVGWDYSDTGAGGPFTQTVDIKRVYNDTSTQAILSRPQGCDTCETETGTACFQVSFPRLGVLRVTPDPTACTRFWQSVKFYYRAGLSRMTEQAEDAIMRLAHSKMPTEPCGCDPAKTMWERDRAVPEFIPSERYSSPFGVHDGAWAAWLFTQAMMLRTGGVL